MELFKFIDGTESDLSRNPFIEMDYATVCNNLMVENSNLKWV